MGVRLSSPKLVQEAGDYWRFMSSAGLGYDEDSGVVSDTSRDSEVEVDLICASYRAGLGCLGIQ